MNETKPRKGCFVVSIKTPDKEDKIIIELLDLQRPFSLLKALDVEAVIAAALGK